MLVLGECDKIVDELFENNSVHPINSIEVNRDSGGGALHSILELGDKDLIESNSFSLKTAKKKAVDKVEKEIISYVLAKTDWNRSKASRILKVSYKTLLNKITELNINPPTSGGDFNQ